MAFDMSDGADGRNDCRRSRRQHLESQLSAAELIRLRARPAAALGEGRYQELSHRAPEDRMRMARDLHDVVAHNISVISVQAKTALHLMDRQPERAREALSAINDVSRQALAELRSVLGILRGTDEGAPRAPSPGLGRLDELAHTMGTAGVAVRVVQQDARFPLPAHADLAAYRIIQEALTNVARHSGGVAAKVLIRFGTQGVESEVDDDGPAAEPGTPAQPAGGSGNGIAGMTERAQASGGWLHAGPRPGGGFHVHALLPTRPGGQSQRSAR
jgi:signal transduction histidine kinase